MSGKAPMYESLARGEVYITTLNFLEGGRISMHIACDECPFAAVELACSYCILPEVIWGVILYTSHS